MAVGIQPSQLSHPASQALDGLENRLVVVVPEKIRTTVGKHLRVSAPMVQQRPHALGTVLGLVGGLRFRRPGNLAVISDPEANGRENLVELITRLVRCGRSIEDPIWTHRGSDQRNQSSPRAGGGLIATDGERETPPLRVHLARVVSQRDLGQDAGQFRPAVEIAYEFACLFERPRGERRVLRRHAGDSSFSPTGSMVSRSWICDGRTSRLLNVSATSWRSSAVDRLLLFARSSSHAAPTS